MSDFGKRGGTGATGGKKARTLIDPTTGRKVRTFKAGTWLSVLQVSETAPTDVRVFDTEGEARAWVEWRGKDLAKQHAAFPRDIPQGRHDVEYVVQARPA